MSSAARPNVIFILPDQIRASALPLYGEPNIQTPQLDRLAQEGMTFTNAISSAPVCTPYRSMLLTGRHPQTTGHVINFIRTRHDEIGLGDAFSKAGYRTAYFGKWHLHTGSFPEIAGHDYVPEGRDRLGFQHWRGYNFHMDYFNGSINLDDWHTENWRGYETNALNRYAFDFMDSVGDDPFFMVVLLAIRLIGHRTSLHQRNTTTGCLHKSNYRKMSPKTVENRQWRCTAITWR